MMMQNLIGKEQALATAQFDKRCLLLDVSSCAFPTDLSQLFTSLPWADEELQQSKEQLNTVKNRIDNIPKNEWDRAVSQANRADDVKPLLRKTFQAELCTVAWAKMYECIVYCNLLPIDSPALGQASDGNPLSFTCHLCEAPGAFISATNHYIRTHRPYWWWDWLAISLNPHFEGNDNDKLINETMPNWCWGDDSSGDLRRLPNMEKLWSEARARAGGNEGGTLSPGAMLVTADGAVDTSMDPNRQEEICSVLHLCEIVAAVGLLALGGHFMWKAFTLFEHATIGSIYLMGCLFDEVAVYKPATSRPANSEVYIVGRGFKGISPEVMEALKSKVSPDDIFGSCSIFSKAHLEDSGGFLASAKKAALDFSQWQQEALIEALDQHGSKNSTLTSARKETQKWFSKYWINELKVMHLDRSLFLAPHADIDGRSNNSNEAAGKKRRLEGTLEERQAQFKKRSTAIAGPGSRAAPPLAVMKEEAGATRVLDGGLGMKVEDGLSGLEAMAGPSGIPSMNPKALAMMSKMGYRAGEGLGAEGRQGSAQAVEARGNKARAGLGAGSRVQQAEPTEGVDWALRPSAKWLTNDKALEYGFQPSLAAIPPGINKSRLIPDDDILSGLISVTLLAHEYESSGDVVKVEGGGEGRVKRRVCSHQSPLDASPSQGCCLAPRKGSSEMFGPSEVERSWFKFGSLDVSLSIIAEARLLMHPPRPGLERPGGWFGPPNFFLLDIGTKNLLRGPHDPKAIKNELCDEAEEAGGSKMDDQKAKNDGGYLCASDYILSAVTNTLDVPRGSEVPPDQSEVMESWKERIMSIPAALLSKDVKGGQEDAQQANPLHAFYSLETSAEICALVGGGLAQSWTSTAALVLGDLRSQALPSHLDQGLRPLEVEHVALYRKKLLFEALTGLSCLIPGGCMVLRMSHTLTSFSITLIYALYRSFEKLWIGQPFSSCSSSPERFLVLCRRIDDQGAAAALIAQALALECESQIVMGCQLVPESKAVADILPLNVILTDKPFYSYLATATSTLAERQTRFLKVLLDEKVTSPDPTRVDGEGQSRVLREEAQRARSIKAIVKERGDLALDPSSLHPAPRWAPQARPDYSQAIVPEASVPLPALEVQPDAIPPPLAPLPPCKGPDIFPLFIMHAKKGKELVCSLRISPWPQDGLEGMSELCVHRFVPRAEVSRHLSMNRVLMARPVSGGDIKALNGFVEYLYNAGKDQGAAAAPRKERVAMVKWGSLDFYLTLRLADDPNYIPHPQHGLYFFF